jgi:hypothetical protein
MMRDWSPTLMLESVLMLSITSADRRWIMTSADSSAENAVVAVITTALQASLTSMQLK